MPFMECGWDKPVREKNWKFNPLHYGFYPVSKVPELKELFAGGTKRTYAKIICRDDTIGAVWYLWCAGPGLGLSQDDRWRFVGGVHKPGQEWKCVHKPGQEWKSGYGHQHYLGCISNKTFAKQLMLHLLGTMKNKDVKTIGAKRLAQHPLAKGK